MILSISEQCCSGIFYHVVCALPDAVASCDGDQHLNRNLQREVLPSCLTGNS